MNKNKLKELITNILVNHRLSKKHAVICYDALINAELFGDT